MKAVAVFSTVAALKFNAKLEPAEVSDLLADVEKDWVSNALLSLQKKITNKEAKDEMVESCSTVVTSIVKASEGEKSRVQEYMQDVCNVSHDTGNCKEFGDAVLGLMTEDAAENREGLNIDNFCVKFYGTVSDQALIKKQQMDAKEAEKKKVAAALAAKKAKELKLKQEAEKKAKEEAAKLAAEAAKKAAAEKKAQLEAEKKKAEEAKKAAAEKEAKALKEEQKMVKLSEAKAKAESELKKANEKAQKAKDEAKKAGEALKKHAKKEEKASKEAWEAQKVAEKHAVNAKVAEKKVVESKPAEKKVVKKVEVAKKPVEAVNVKKVELKKPVASAKKVEVSKEHKEENMLNNRIPVGATDLHAATKSQVRYETAKKSLNKEESIVSRLMKKVQSVFHFH